MATATPASAGSHTAVASGHTAVASGHVTISGSGSHYASAAIDLWSQDLLPDGIVVNYNPDGSPAGLQDYMSNQDDFAVSDMPFRGPEKLGDLPPQNPRRVTPTSPPSPAAPRCSAT